VRKVGLPRIALFTLVAGVALGSGSALAAEPIAVPTTATIFKGKLIDRIPGPPATQPGVTRRPTGVSIPFYGRISSPHPACATDRRYQFGSGEEGKFVDEGGVLVPQIVYGSASPVPDDGKWRTELENTWSQPIRFVVRVLPKDTVYEGVPYHCEEAVSPELVVDKSDFSPCELARAAKRGYAPSVRVLKRLLREAESHGWPVARRYREELKKARRSLPVIKRAVAERC
jgi:hypothetical protein